MRRQRSDFVSSLESTLPQYDAIKTDQQMFGRAIETLLMTNKKLRLDTTHGIAGRSTDFNMEEEKVDGRQMVKLLTDVGGLENRDSVCQK